MEYQLEIPNELDQRINDICYAYLNQWENDFAITDRDIAVFIMYIENKLLNIRNKDEIDKIEDKRVLKTKII